jgi:hypothetical protein
MLLTEHSSREFRFADREVVPEEQVCAAMLQLLRSPVNTQQLEEAGHGYRPLFGIAQTTEPVWKSLRMRTL